MQEVGYTSDNALRSKQPGGNSRKALSLQSSEKAAAHRSQNYIRSNPARTETVGEMAIVIKSCSKQNSNKDLVPPSPST